MFHDGVIGNLSIINVLGALTAGQFNKLLPKEKTPFTLKQIIPQVYDYLYPPLTEQEKRKQVNDSLMAFAKMNPNAPKNLFGEN